MEEGLETSSRVGGFVEEGWMAAFDDDDDSGNGPSTVLVTSVSWGICDSIDLRNLDLGKWLFR